MGKNRPEPGTACGFHAVESLLARAPQQLQEVLLDRKRGDGRLQRLRKRLQVAGIANRQAEREELDKRSSGVRHQGVVALVTVQTQRPETGLVTLLEGLDSAPLLLVLDQVQDPHNLGACLRTAEGAGVDAVVLPRDGACPVNDTVRRVAAGAAERLAVFYVGNLARTLEALQQQGIWLLGGAGEGEQSLFEADLCGPLALVIGAEGKGLRRLTRERCDALLRIPMAGDIASLNVSVATGIFLFEAVRQRTEVDSLK